MKKKISLIFFIIAIVAAVFMTVIVLYSWFIGEVNNKDHWMFGAGTIVCLSLIIYDYLKNSKLSGVLIFELLLFLILFLLAFL